jgi:hypothetical protein
MTPEGKIQAHLRKLVKAEGGLTRKVRWEGRNGAPDLLVLLNGTTWVEVKAPGEFPKPHQIEEHRRMRERGADVRVIDTIEGCELLVAELVARRYDSPVKGRRRRKC